MTFIPIPMSAVRICDGLSKIGYTPPSAICDIIDNSAVAKAKHVYVKIMPERDLSENRLNNVKEYLIIDDGKGMSKEEMELALMLGSPSDNYEPHSLSKFGLGLKSAAFSQGEILEVISSTGEADFLKYRVSLPEIRTRGEYGADTDDISKEDSGLIEEYLFEGHGTIIRIASVRKNDHPSIRSTLQDLRTKVGAIYYYIMQEEDFHVIINDEECQPFDVLFTDEANKNGNLNEHDWDGKTTRWIQKPYKVVINAERNVIATIEVTQLPHPPTFDLEGPGKRNSIRDKYHITANNYGFYVYRNRRLLSWCESLDIIPQDQDFYAFRGRILVDDSADDAFNIDVKKSHLHLSDESYTAIEDVSYEFKRKSKKAWQHAKEELKRITGEDGLTLANTIAQQFEMPEELPGIVETEADYQEAKHREKELEQEQRKRVEELVAQVENEPEVAGLDEEEQIKIAVAGPEAGPGDKIFQVSNTTDNTLWEPYYDAEKGPCVRINRLHRFIRVIYENNPNNGALHTLTGLMFLQLAGAEYYVIRNLTKYHRDEIASILEEYRRAATEYIAKLCRDLGDSLPSE